MSILSALLHQKMHDYDAVLVRDRARRNFDDQTFETNDEITVSFIDGADRDEVRRRLRAIAGEGSEIELERWSRRSPLHKSSDQMYYLFNELL